VWLGGISYAFYLVHYLVLDYGHIPIGATRTWPVPAALGILAVMLAVATTAAWLLTRLVEEPAMRRWARPRARPAIPREPTVASPAPSPETATLP
jgi:peptidoglycan/LPS O-acetylase OafA/YrhL